MKTKEPNCTRAVTKWVSDEVQARSKNLDNEMRIAFKSYISVKWIRDVASHRET